MAPFCLRTLKSLKKSSILAAKSEGIATPLILRPGQQLARLARTKDVVHGPDILADEQGAPVLAKLTGARALPTVPMLKEGRAASRGGGGAKVARRRLAQGRVGSVSDFDEVWNDRFLVAINWGSQLGCLFRLQIGCFDHATPFLGLLGEVLSEFGGRSNKGRGAQVRNSGRDVET